MSPRQIAELRRNGLGVSQSIFARLLNVALQTVHAWEQGTRKPTGSALRLLNLAAQKPITLKRLVTGRTGQRVVEK